MLGTGLVCLRAVRFEGPVWLRLPVALFAGVALACTFAVVVLVGGAGVLTLRILSCLLLAIGVWGVSWNSGSAIPATGGSISLRRDG
jgi:hypothetical protein